MKEVRATLGIGCATSHTLWRKRQERVSYNADMIIFEKQRRIVRSGSSYGQAEVKAAFGTLSATEIVLRDPID